MTTYTVSDYQSLLNALNNVSYHSATDVINVTASFTISNSSFYPLVLDLGYNENLTINGNGHQISGLGANFGGLFVAAQYGSSTNAQLAINGLTITGMTANGGAGTNGGGGGAALGAGLFIGTGVAATLTNVAVTNNAAIGGAGGNADAYNYGAGGSLADTFKYYNSEIEGYQGGSAGGGAGGFGAGGGSGVQGGAAGFGGGGSGDSVENYGGNQIDNLGAPGYGGGAAASNPDGSDTDSQGTGAGGGGLAAGGGIFVQSGATLTIAGAFQVSGNTVTGGAGGTDSGGRQVYTPDNGWTTVPGPPGQAGSSLGSGRLSHA